MVKEHLESAEKKLTIKALSYIKQEKLNFLNILMVNNIENLFNLNNLWQKNSTIKIFIPPT
jgi:hypothetical protein